jgi:hypothetical protein
MHHTSGGARGKRIRAGVVFRLLLTLPALLLGCGRARMDSARPLSNPSALLPSLTSGIQSVAALADGDDDAPVRREHPVSEDTISLQLESDCLPADGVLRGSIGGRWGGDIVRVLWIDSAGRVVSAAELRRKKGDDTPLAFSVQKPVGAIGASHRLAVVRAKPAGGGGKKNGEAALKFRIVAEAPFRIAEAAPPWDDYLLIRTTPPAAAPLFSSLATAIEALPNTASPLAANGGRDWSQLASSPDWVEPHQPSWAQDLLQSLNPKLRIVTRQKNNSPRELRRLWEHWLRGGAGCMPLAPADASADAVFQELASGLSLLRASATSSTSPVAVYYSPRSMRIHWMLDSLGGGSQWMLRDDARKAARGSARLQLAAWHALLEDLGLHPRFVPPAELLAGLDPARVKVLILPKALSLSQAEADALREFARGGGMVLADGQCGLFDGSGKRRPQSRKRRAAGALDDCFGITRQDFIANERDGVFVGDPGAARVFIQSEDGQPVGPASAELRVLEPGVRAREGRVPATGKGGAAAIIDRAEGKERYARVHGQPAGGEALRVILSDLLADALPENTLRVSSADGSPARRVNRWRFDLCPGAQLVALLPDAEAPPPADGLSVALGGVRHWYDLRSGAYLGEGETARASLPDSGPLLLAALSYRVERLQLRLHRTDPRGAYKISASLLTGGESPGSHVFHLSVFDPAGARMAHYEQNIRAWQGAWNGELILGLNEPEGIYRLVLRDVLSGKTTEGDLLKEGSFYTGIAPSVSTPRRDSGASPN